MSFRCRFRCHGMTETDDGASSSLALLCLDGVLVGAAAGAGLNYKK